MYNKLIDHTLLKAFATKKEIIQLCREAKTYDFMSVCINPAFVSLAKKELAGSDVYVCTVIGFPLGANTIEVKAAETIDAINNGADEIDMVINISKAKEHDYEYIYEEIKAVVAVSQSKIVKVIIETCHLTDKEKIEVCKCASLAGALFVKTSTGFGTGGATIKDVKLMRENILSEMSVKASGGIRDLKFMKELVEAGASRIGASSGVAIMKELKKEKK
ncbi:MAG TPA: deoxyribose-phosphate aldolase [Acholeplasmataceae bacterium]|nr:deoxyribose-phosphate aldolase [Acholeplasmataceae bacterium]